jgi:hypothetical protein
MLPNAPTWKHSDGVYLFHGVHRLQEIPSNARVTFFPGTRKPWHPYMQARFPNIYDRYVRYL